MKVSFPGVKTRVKIGVVLGVGLILSGCLSPTYLDAENGVQKGSGNNLFGEVNYHVYKSYKDNPPGCVAVLPLTTTRRAGVKKPSVSFDQAEIVRKAMYSHLSPQGKRDVEIPRIDFILDTLSDKAKTNYRLVGKKLNCDALIVGNVTEYDSEFVGLYSKVAVGAQLKMIRAETGEVIWKGEHVASTHGGSVPLSPIGLLTGIIDAAMNVEEEQILRVVDDLARRLVSTIPDNRVAILEDPLSSPVVGKRKGKNAWASVDDFFANLEGRPVQEQKQALMQAITDHLFYDDDLKRVYDKLIETVPNDAVANGMYAQNLVDGGDYFKALKYVKVSLRLDDGNGAMYFLKGRIQIKLNDLSGADASIIQAIAHDKTSAEYLNGLGFLNSLRGNHERALAAYQMAIDLNPTNGYALYNMGVTFFNTGDLLAAREYIYKASQVYLQGGDYGQVVKALADLKELASLGIDAEREIRTLETALATL